MRLSHKDYQVLWSMGDILITKLSLIESGRTWLTREMSLFDSDKYDYEVTDVSTDRPF